jgi:hypothetical protein
MPAEGAGDDRATAAAIIVLTAIGHTGWQAGIAHTVDHEDRTYRSSLSTARPRTRMLLRMAFSENR